MSSDTHIPRRVSLTEDMIRTLSREEIVSNLRQLNQYVSYLESKSSPKCQSDDQITDSDDKSRHHRSCRQAKDEQESVTQEQKQAAATAAQLPSVSQLRTTLLDPAVNLLFQKMKKQIDQKQERVEQAQNELSAWQFTPDSQTGKKLMSKCRTLIQENQELGRQLSQGRTAQLEAELALQKKQHEHLQCSQNELSDVSVQLDEEMQAIQTMVITLQNKLRDTQTKLTVSQAESVHFQALIHTYQQQQQQQQLHTDRPRTPDDITTLSPTNPDDVEVSVSSPSCLATDVDMETNNTELQQHVVVMPTSPHSVAVGNQELTTQSDNRAGSPGVSVAQRNTLSRVLIDSYESEGSAPSTPPPPPPPSTQTPASRGDTHSSSPVRSNPPQLTTEVMMDISTLPNGVSSSQRQDHHHDDVRTTNRKQQHDPLSSSSRGLKMAPPGQFHRNSDTDRTGRPSSPPSSGDINTSSRTTTTTTTTGPPSGTLMSQSIHKLGEHYHQGGTSSGSPASMSSPSSATATSTAATSTHTHTECRTNNGLSNGLQGEITDSSDEMMSD